MKFFKQRVDLRDKKTIAAIFGTIILFITLPLTVLGTLQFKEGTQHLKTKAALPSIESMPFPRVLNYKYLTSTSSIPCNESDDEFKAAVEDQKLHKYTGLVVSPGSSCEWAKALQFKRLYSDRLVIQYTNPHSNRPGADNPSLAETYPGYFILMNYAELTADISDTDTTIHVQRGANDGTERLPFNPTPLNPNPALIWEPDPDGGGPFGKNPRVEYVEVTDVGSDSITVTREAYRKDLIPAKSFKVSANAKIAALSSGTTSGTWQLNQARMSPEDPKNHLKLNQWLADRMASELETYIDGYEFDVARWFVASNSTNGNIKNFDCDVNGEIDYCNQGINTSSQISSYGVGYSDFVARLRAQLPGKLLLGDQGYRAFDSANGAEFESFPNGDNYEKSSSDLADLEFYLTRSQEPRISYSFTKQETYAYPNKLNRNTLGGTNKRNRFGLVASLLYSGFHTYAAYNSEWKNYPWDEDGGVIHTADPPDGTGLDTGYLGQPKQPETLRRITTYIPDPDNDMIFNGSFENDTSGWDIYQNTAHGYQADDISRDETAGPDGDSSLKAKVNLIAADPDGGGVNIEYVGGLTIQKNSEYTAVFWAKANGIREITVGLRQRDTPKKDLSSTESFRIDSTWRPYYINLETWWDFSESSFPAVLEFRVGREIGEYWFDGVEFYQGTAEIMTREFDHGLVVLNGSSISRTIDLGDTHYKKINGKQKESDTDPSVNDGSTACNGQPTCPLTIPAQDAIILLKIPDTEDPTVSITSPVHGATVSDTVTITADATDNFGVTKVEFYVDTSTKIGEDATSPYSISWDTTTVSDGDHTLTAKAYDAADNVGTSPTVGVTVSNPTGKIGDIDGDGEVDIFDLSILLTRWGTDDSAADLNGNGEVDIFDLSILLTHWGS